VGTYPHAAAHLGLCHILIIFIKGAFLMHAATSVTSTPGDVLCMLFCGLLWTVFAAAARLTTVQLLHVGPLTITP
jgi:hypothetical protein